jgi:RimJ/RimL family protein N-acetyltransferase
LTIRPFEERDLDAVYQLLDVDLAAVDFGTTGDHTRAARRDWLLWSIASYEQLANLKQPPYGDRAVVLDDDGPLIGACGFVPCLNAFTQIPSLAPLGAAAGSYTAEVGLYYAFAPAHQRRGYATEAVQALVTFAFADLGLHRIVATTTYDNQPSIGVMRRLGMRIERNPLPDPPWLQVVGVLDKPPADG